MAEDKSKDAVFQLTVTVDFVTRFTQLKTLDEFVIALNSSNPKFVGILHGETDDKVAHLHLFIFCAYQQKKKKEIIDALYALNVFNADARSDLESWVLGVVVKLEKIDYARIAKLMIQRDNASAVNARQFLSSRCSFFQCVFRTLEDYQRKTAEGTLESHDQPLSCMSVFSTSDRNRIRHMTRLFKQDEKASDERIEIFERIRSTEKKKFENYDALNRLVKLCQAKSPQDFELKITESERIILFCGIPQYDSILEEIFKVKVKNREREREIILGM